MKKKHIAIMADDSPGLITGILAILKSGNCFVPINPIFPNDRIRFILKDCNIEIFLTDKANYEKACHIVNQTPSISIHRLICIDDIPGRESTGVLGEKDRSSQCYVIYTSGSTGKPKGVPITHQNLSLLLYFARDYLGLGQETRVMQNLSYTFDFGIFEILTTILFGGRLYALNKLIISDFSFYPYYINLRQINTLHTTPVFISNLADMGQKMPSIKLVHLGGEKLTGEVVNNFLNVIPPEGRLFNGYGPTETTINCTFFPIKREKIEAGLHKNIPIGRPCDQHNLYILDKFFNLQSIGAAGELCIAGPGLSAGYLNRPELTAEKFIKNNSNWTSKPYILYRTGDLSRWLPDGNIEFLGRIDHQVKIRGFRIELGEIENCLSLYPSIKDTVVIAREHENGGNYLCAYVVARSQERLSISQLREFLSKRLPDYMVPAYFIHLDSIPLTPNGKVDRKALPEPDEAFIDTGAEYVAPVTVTEKKLASIWQSILSIRRIGINDDFFQIGGDSILVNRCIARIREELHAEIPLRKFFERPNIKALAEEIEKQERQITSIKPVARLGEIPLSFAQERLWFLQELDADNVAYFVPRVIRMNGKLDITLIERTFTEIIRRHEILRTIFPTVDGRPVQRVQSPSPFKIPLMEWLGLEREEQEKRIANFLSEEGQRPFDFERGPLLRVTIIKLKEEEHLFVLTEHHLIHDGWTQGVLLKEFIAIFTAYSEGKGHDLAELPIQYADFAIWQRNLLKGDVLEQHLNYWKDKLSGMAPLLELPVDRPRPPVISGKGELEIVRLSGPDTLRLKQFSRKNGATLFMTMLALFKTLLYRYTGVEDLCVGSGVANRRYKEMEGMLGMVINTLPLRTQVQGEISFRECLNRVKGTCLEAYQHEDTPFGKVVEVLQPERNLGYTPIFQVLFSFMDTPGEQLRLPGLELELLPTHNRSAKFDINVVIVPPREQGEQEENEVGETLVEWEYNTDIFDAPTIHRMVSHYGRLLEEGLGQPEMSISSLSLMSDEELKQVLYEFNNTGTVYPCDKTIHALFEEQAAKMPDCVGLVGLVGPGGQVRPVRQIALSYCQLNGQSQNLAGVLIEKGVLADDTIGIMIERSIDLITGILGILKAGAAYLPIDPDYPKERIDYMLKESRTAILLTDKNEEEIIVNCQLLIVTCKPINTPKAPLHHSTFNIHHSNQLAYIMYTSGSSGQPKGTVVTHRNVVRLVKNSNFVPLNKETRILQTGAPVFDATTFEIWGSLLNGGQLVLADKEIILDGQRLGKALLEHKINTLWLSAPLFNRLQQQNNELFAPLNYLLVGGDILSPNHINRVMGQFPGLKIINGYGPTENTTFSTTFEIYKEYKENIPIGKPIANSTALIFDKNCQLVPVGVWGELYVGGDGVAWGYLNNPELTAEKFISNSFYRTPRTNILYKTGDLARWLSDGNIEFKGRIDQQVKIRGFRIELGEIEGRLLKHDLVKEAVVIDRNAGEEKHLCAYIVATAGNENAPGAAELRTYLQGSLPDYMIPSFFIFIERIPLNPNGKVDRKSLPEPGAGETAKDFSRPRDTIEKKMVEIWSEILKPGSPIGIDDNFFDLGGHSLNATVLTTRMHKVFNVKIPLKVFLQGGCIREVAEYIRGAVKEEFTFIEPVERKEYYPLSTAQKRMFILQRMDEAGIAYNIPAIMVLEGALDENHLEGVFLELIHRHESLRTSFITINEEPVQRVSEVFGSPGTFFQKGSWPPEALPGEQGLSKFIQPFDLSQAPLMRVWLFKEEAEKYLLMVDMHHIITDGTSMELFVKEFTALYAGQDLPPLKLQYKDYAVWQGGERKKSVLKMQEEYWLKEFSGIPPALDLPLDFPRPVVQSFEGRGYSFDITDAETEALKVLASGHGTTLYMALLTLYSIFLSKITGQEDMVVGTPVAGRSHADLEPIMGMFVNTLALRNYPVWDKHVSGFLKEVNENTLAAFANQDYPYEELVDRVVTERNSGRNPLFDTLLNLRNMDVSEIMIPGLRIRPFPYEESISKFDLTLRVFDGPETLRFTFEYCSRLFKRETIERFACFFKAVIGQVIREPQAKIAEIEIISEAEKEQILFAFNNTAVDYPCDKTIHVLFGEQASKTPDHISVVSHGQTRTGMDKKVCLAYQHLNQQSEKLARILIEKGVLADDIVAIMMERSIELVIGILGILKAGGVYLPIDPEYPQERIDYMLKDSGTAILLTDKNEEEIIVNCQLLIVNCKPINTPKAPLHHSSFIIHHSNAAYVMYTSGSTGQPKGVVVTHRNVVRLVKNNHFVPLTQETRILQTGAPVFDATTLEVWGSLLNSGQLVLVDKKVILDAQRLGQTLKNHCINTLWLSAPLFNQLMQENIGLFVPLNYLLVGGDTLSPEHINLVKQKYPALKIINGYGPTENTTFSTTYLIEKEFEHNIPIGRPITNSTAYICDKYNRLTPIGVTGELVVGGDGVALGYLNNPELTVEKFIDNRSYRTPRTYICYKTGDLARWLNDGTIEFLGRIDHQVKIRGFRIELGEIENQLLKLKMIKDAAVIVRDSKENKYLCAYIVARDSYVVSSDELRVLLAAELPDYMMPSFFVFLDQLPLNPNGKIDRRALPEPQTLDMKIHYTAPVDIIEEKLAEIWAGVLGIEKNNISSTANFFTLGGHSLKATVMLARIQKTFSVKLGMAEIFNSPTIQELANAIRKSEKITFYGLEPIEKQEYYKLSYNQKRLWIINQWDPIGSAFNMPGIIALNHEVDILAIKQTLRFIIERHESFRTGFKIVANEPVQFILKEIDLPFEMIDLSSLDENEKDLAGQKVYLEMTSVPFELNRPPLFRARLVKRNPGRYELLYNIHHIIADGWSLEILQREFFLFYEAYRAGNAVEAEPLSIGYKDFAAWHNKQLYGGTGFAMEGIGASGGMKDSHLFWEKKLALGVPVLELPADFIDNPGDLTGASYQYLIDTDLAGKLKKLAEQNNMSLFMVMFSLYILLISRFSGQEDITCSIIAAGREQAALQKIIGFFVNSIIFTDRVDENMPFCDFLARTRSDILEVFKHQDYPLELVCEELKIKYPKIPVSFNMINFDSGVPSYEQEVFLTEPFHILNKQDAKFDIELYVKIYDNRFILDWSYRKGMFQPATIEYIGGEYLRLANYFIGYPDNNYRDYKNMKKKRSLKRNE